MASSSAVQELVEQFENASVQSDDSVNTPRSQSTANDTDDGEDRPFNAPRKCYGFKWVKSKGLFLCPKDASADCRHAFCGKTHKQNFQGAPVICNFSDLFYHLLVIISDKRPDLEKQFNKEVVPFFILRATRHRKHKGRPLLLTFNSLEDAVEFEHDLKHNIVANFRKFFHFINPDLRAYLRGLASYLGVTPDKTIEKWGASLAELKEDDFSDVKLRYYIDLA